MPYNKKKVINTALELKAQEAYMHIPKINQLYLSSFLNISYKAIIE